MPYFEDTIDANSFEDVEITPGDDIRISHDRHIHVLALYGTEEIPLYDGIAVDTFPIETSPATIRIRTYNLPAFVSVVGNAEP